MQSVPYHWLWLEKNMESLWSVPTLRCGALGLVGIGFLITNGYGVLHRGETEGRPPELLLVSHIDVSGCLHQTLLSVSLFSCTQYQPQRFTRHSR